AGGDRLVQVERVADDHHPVADAHRVAVAELDVAQVVAGVDLEQRDVRRGVGSLDHGRVVAVVQVDLDLRGALDDVIVGDHETVPADDETAAARVGPELLGLPIPIPTTGLALARTEKELERIVPAIATTTPATASAAVGNPGITTLFNGRGLNRNDRGINGLRQVREARQRSDGGLRAGNVRRRQCDV